jgi:hypothetical protein
MHYRNGRKAVNGDKVIQLTDANYGEFKVTAIGVLYDAVPGNDYCNGNIASIIGGPIVTACLCDCLHMGDVLEILKVNGLDKRPEGK